MPSHSPASAVLRLHFATAPPGQIWLKDDEPLPQGLSHDDIPLLRSFFTKYISLPNETERLRFALGLKGSDIHPRRSQVNYAHKNIQGVRDNAREVWQSLTNKKRKQPKL
ncbi:hypothetical protein H0H93_008465 [Arthromyces matolae]|nr:hypothetical protein H0H93_008465 [Arthromyces matolae]